MVGVPKFIKSFIDNKFIPYFMDPCIGESDFLKRKISYNYMVMIISLIISSIFAVNIMSLKDQQTEDPLVFFAIIVLLSVNLLLFKKGIYQYVIPSYSLVIFSSIWTYFYFLPPDFEVNVIAIFAFITVIWSFISYKRWHRVMHFINFSLVIVLRLYVLFTSYTHDEISIDLLLANINAYILLFSIGILLFIVHRIMEREILYAESEKIETHRKQNMMVAIYNLIHTQEFEDSHLLENITELEMYFDSLTGCLNTRAFE